MFFDKKIVENQAVHLALGKSIEGIGRGIHDGLAFQVKGGIQYHGHAGRASEALN